MNDRRGPAIFVALEQSGFAAAIRQSPWLYPAANVGHIIFLTLFAGAIAVMDVRLLGGLSATAPGPLLARTRNVALAALAGMALTGSLIFSAEASHLALNPVFQLKAVLVAAGLINVAIYQFWAKLAVEHLAPSASMPARAVTGALPRHLDHGCRLRPQHRLFLGAVRPRARSAVSCAVLGEWIRCEQSQRCMGLVSPLCPRPQHHRHDIPGGRSEREHGKRKNGA